jgi:hypothetical protein
MFPGDNISPDDWLGFTFDSDVDESSTSGWQFTRMKQSKIGMNRLLSDV